MKKLPLIIVRALIVAIIVYFLSFYVFTYIATPIVEKHEKQLIDTDIKFITHALKIHTNHVEILADDWAFWDDAHIFVKDLNTKFIETNMNNETLRNADINIVVFLDSKGSVVYKKTVALEKGQVVEIPGEIYKENKNNSIHKEVLEVVNSKKGIFKNIQTGQGLLTYSVYPILKSNGEGPVNGAIFLGRYFNTADIDRIKLETDADFEIRNFVNADDKLQQQLIKNAPIHIFGTKNITTNKLIRDSKNTPSLYLIFRHPRHVYFAVNELIPIFAFISAVIGIFGDFVFSKLGHITKYLRKV